MVFQLILTLTNGKAHGSRHRLYQSGIVVGQATLLLPQGNGDVGRQRGGRENVIRMVAFTVRHRVSR